MSQRLPGRVLRPLGRVAGPLDRVMASPRPYRRAVSWSPCCTPLSPVSRYNALYRDQVQKWAVAQPDFLHYFFFFITATGKTTQYIYIYIYSINQINLLKFILFNFFSSFTHCKTLEIFFSNSEPFCPKFLEHLRLHFLDPSVQHLSYAIHKAYNFNHTTHNNSCYAHHSHMNHNNHTIT